MDKQFQLPKIHYDDSHTFFFIYLSKFRYGDQGWQYGTLVGYASTFAKKYGTLVRYTFFDHRYSGRISSVILAESVAATKKAEITLRHKHL